MNGFEFDDFEFDDFDETEVVTESKPQSVWDQLINNNIIVNNNIEITNKVCPVPEPLYISTKTKIVTLNQGFIDVDKLFWNVNLIPYFAQCEGIIKKEKRFRSLSQEEVNDIQKKFELESDICEWNGVKYTQLKRNEPISLVVKPAKYKVNAKSKKKIITKSSFTDIRKISVGINKSDIDNVRSKQKKAFFNCDVFNLRIKHEDKYQDYHVKLFNTSELEVPGIKCDETYELVCNKAIALLQPYFDTEIRILPNTCRNVLINSNFKCNYLINRLKLYEILKDKYDIKCSYNPDNYPGVKCQYYCNAMPDENNNYIVPNNEVVLNKNKKKSIDKNVHKVSIMIFRTGSVLIVGNITETILYNMYTYIINILTTEFVNIYAGEINKGDENEDDECYRKTKKSKKTFIQTIS